MLVQMVVIRQCNLTCAYCNEYDDYSPPLPTELLERQIDHVASLGTLVLTLTGGEPLLHPDLDRLIARAADRGMVCTTISNAYPITRDWIRRLNEAGLSLLQVSVDNLAPNETSQKSLNKIRHKLELLKTQAQFSVNVNAVLGSCPPDDTRTLVETVENLGFYMTVGLMHDGQGQLDPGLAGDELANSSTRKCATAAKKAFHGIGEGWESEMIRGQSSPFKCRAGGRYLYVDEFGRVSYCSQRRGEPGTPLLHYGKQDLQDAFHTPKVCESGCTISCVRARVWAGRLARAVRRAFAAQTCPSKPRLPVFQTPSPIHRQNQVAIYSLEVFVFGKGVTGTGWSKNLQSGSHPSETS